MAERGDGDGRAEPTAAGEGLALAGRLSRRQAVVVVGGTTLATLAGAAVVHLWFADRVWPHLAAHAAIEAIGAFAALALGRTLVLLYERGQARTEEGWVACALGAMGVLDALHATTLPGDLLVWSHSLAVLVGGVLFALVWDGRVSVASRALRRRFVGLLAVAGLFGLATLLVPKLVPRVIVPGGFTWPAVAANVVGGLGFWIGAARFLRPAWSAGDRASTVFATLGLLFGLAGFLFAVSAAWALDWWLWHVVRLAAFLVALAHLFDVVRVVLRDLEWAGQRQRQQADALRVEVEERRRVAEHLQVAQRQLLEGVEVLSGATRQIAESIESAALGLAETTAAVEETAVTASRLRDGAESTASHADGVAAAANEGLAAAAEGRASMASLRTERELVAAAILAAASELARLGERTQALEGINRAVAELAEHSHIVSLNAAIEAERAGVHGACFAVVVAEMRLLAEQSREATVHVRGVLRQMQQAVATAARAADGAGAGTQRLAERGAEAESTIARLADQMIDAARRAREISARVEQQSVSLREVDLAMQQVRQASRKNLAGVQGVQEAVRKLKALGEDLRVAS